MKKLVILGALLTALIVPATASAWTQVGICRLHAYTPSAQPGGVQAHGRVDTCGGITGEAHIQLQVCLQVQGAGGYGAFTKQETCQTVGPYNALSEDVRSSIATDAVRGHVYRTWDWANVNGTTGWYTSDWWTY
jgi:hypothetical protein